MKKKFLALMTASALALSLAACGGSSSSAASGSAASSAPASSGATSGAASGSAGGTFKIGVIGPLTGDNAIYGQAVANGGSDRCGRDQRRGRRDPVRDEERGRRGRRRDLRQRLSTTCRTGACRCWLAPPPPALPPQWLPRPTMTGSSC